MQAYLARVLPGSWRSLPSLKGKDHNAPGFFHLQDPP
jgi:hypothetical protein